MSDIVERLRAMRCEDVTKIMPCAPISGCVCAPMTEAAAEIEQLRPLVDETFRDLRWTRDKVHEQSAEIERLRAALEALVMACELPGDHCEVEQTLPAARAALGDAP